MRRVAEGEVERLRWWMGELMRRSDEVVETFRNEGTWQELAYLVQTADGPILVYVMDVADAERADLAFRYSELSIDQEHKSVMHQVLGEEVPAELLYDVRLPPPR